MPPDPDLDDLPEELRERSGPLWIGGVDPDNGDVFLEPITRETIASTFADERRRHETDAD